MNQQDVKKFFDQQAPCWDEHLVYQPDVIDRIMEYADVGEGNSVLDVACGTGILIPAYLDRKVQSVTGIDLSEQMVNIARRKFPETNVRILCGDVETASFNQRFDVIMVYNALPHFTDPERLIHYLSQLLTPSGRLSIAHGMSREKVNQHHLDPAVASISTGLPQAGQLASWMTRDLLVTAVIDDASIFQVCGKKIH